jgi:CheY-like chemotaxis protein
VKVAEDGRASTPVQALPARLLRPVSEKSQILVVDDDQTARDIVRRYLERDGFAVVSAEGGREGLRLARELNPAAITLDVMMPDLDGWTVLAAIKGDPDLAHIPVVMMTILDEKNRGFSLGATDYLVKPIDQDALIQVLRQVASVPVSRILIVDDDEIARHSIKIALENIGWHAAEAVNGRAALDAIDQAQPDAILLDLMMPEMDGFEFLDELRRKAEWRGIPVIVITARDLTEEDRTRLNGGIARVIQKRGRDEMLREVLDSLGRVIDRSRGRTAVA